MLHSLTALCTLYFICCSIAKFVLAIFLPPLAVLMHKGQIDTDFWINLILTIIIYLVSRVAAVLDNSHDVLEYTLVERLFGANFR
jgi:uncharacterized membrane protein YqaE (UPF0057 family)